jgi:hypothetical protein
MHAATDDVAAAIVVVVVVVRVGIVSVVVGAKAKPYKRTPVKSAVKSSTVEPTPREEAVRQWPGCETVGGIQIIRDNTPGGFSVRGTLYGKADKKIADRAINCVQREKRRHFHLND